MCHSEPGQLDGELADMKEGCGYYSRDLENIFRARAPEAPSTEDR
jgi:hypothetical protein